MTVIEATRACLSNYINYSGRASRSEFWKFILFQIIVSALLVLIYSVLFGPQEQFGVKVSIGSDGVPIQSNYRKIQYHSGWFGTIFFLAMLVPTITVAIRRFHDIGRPSWHILVPIPVGFSLAYFINRSNFKELQLETSAFPQGVELPEKLKVLDSAGLFFVAWLIAFSGLVLTIFLLARKSQPGPNKYGPNPQEASP